LLRLKAVSINKFLAGRGLDWDHSITWRRAEESMAAAAKSLERFSSQAYFAFDMT